MVDGVAIRDVLGAATDVALTCEMDREALLVDADTALGLVMTFVINLVALPVMTGDV